MNGEFILFLTSVVILTIIMIVLLIKYSPHDKFTNLIDEKIFTSPLTFGKQRPVQVFKKNDTDASIQDTFSRCETIYGVGNCKYNN